MMSSVHLHTAVAALIRATHPEFKRRHERLIYAAHAYHLCLGYTLIGLESIDDGTVPPEDAPEVGLEGWNAREDLYVFVYRHLEKKLPPLIMKCIVMDNVLVICTSVLGNHNLTPKTMNLNVEETTRDSDTLLGGYTALEALVRRFSEELGEATPPKPSETQRTTQEHPRAAERHLRDPLMMPRPIGRLGNNSMTPRPMIGGQADWMPGGLMGPSFGGSHVGLNHPSFTPQLRHPELQPGRGNTRWDPIAPPGMMGYHPDDFQPQNRQRFNPDLPPQRDPRLDPDHMFG